MSALGANQYALYNDMNILGYIVGDYKSSFLTDHMDYVGLAVTSLTPYQPIEMTCRLVVVEVSLSFVDWSACDGVLISQVTVLSGLYLIAFNYLLKLEF